MSTLGLVLARFVFRPYGTPRIPSGFQGGRASGETGRNDTGIGPGMGLAVVVAVSLLILPGLGSHGPSDPGEMRQAHSAQRMNEAAVVQVIEPLSLPEKTYPTSELLSQTLGTEFSVGTSRLHQRNSREKAKGSAPKELVEARRYREGRLVHGIVLDPQLWPDAPEDEKAMEDLVETIGELSNSAWQVPCILVERRGAAQVSAREALSRTWSELSRESRASRSDASGRGWGDCRIHSQRVGGRGSRGEPSVVSEPSKKNPRHSRFFKPK